MGIRMPMKKAKNILWKAFLVVLIMIVLAKAPILLIPLTGMFIAYLVVKRLYRVLKKDEKEVASNIQSNNQSIRPLKRIKVPKKLKCLYEYELPVSSTAYLPTKDSPCLILTKGLTVIGVGAIELRSLPKGVKGSLAGIFSSAMRLGYSITYVSMYEPIPEEQTWKVRILFIIRTKKLVVRVNDKVVKELVDEIIRKLEWARSAILSSIGLADVNILTGEELAEAVCEVITG